MFHVLRRTSFFVSKIPAPALIYNELRNNRSARQSIYAFSENARRNYLTGVHKDGKFVRKCTFKDVVKADGSTDFAPEMDRYHLYVSLACPWAHRTLLVRILKGLEDVLPYTVVDWHLGEKGWTFTDKKPKCSLDPIYNCQYISELYKRCDPGHSSHFTVPVLWDKKTELIVNNESNELIRMLNSEFNDFCRTEEQRKLDLYPENLREQIDELNSWIYPTINHGVYHTGFAQTQEAYDKAVKELFNSLDKLEDILSNKRYLTGSSLTEADVRLFTTLVRFDMIYHGHFKCNKKRIIDYPNLWGYVRDIYQMKGVASTVDREHITKHYMLSHKIVNPYQIIYIGPDLDFYEPHGRDHMK